MPTTLTGPASFAATIHQPERRDRTGYLVTEDAATYTYTAAGLGPAEQRALFDDYKAQAKALKLDGAHLRAGPWPRALPTFTAPASTAVERQWLGVAVGFDAYQSTAWAPLGNGHCVVQKRNGQRVHGTVWSLAPAASSVWVYVPDEGFYQVSTKALGVGVNR